MKSWLKYPRHCEGCGKFKWCHVFMRWGPEVDYCKDCEPNNTTRCLHCDELVGIPQTKEGYCLKCVHRVITECRECGREYLPTQLNDEGVCNGCLTEEIKQCKKCKCYFDREELSVDDQCIKCNIKIIKKKKKEEVDEVVECLECGRESHIKDVNNKGLCEICEMKEEIYQFKKKLKSKS